MYAIGAVDLAQPAKCLVCKHEALHTVKSHTMSDICSPEACWPA